MDPIAITRALTCIASVIQAARQIGPLIVQAIRQARSPRRGSPRPRERRPPPEVTTAVLGSPQL